MPPAPADRTPAVDCVEFCGEEHPLDPRREFVIGREGDLAIDDNPFLHRRFLTVRHADGLWWLGNVGSRLSATVSDGSAGVQAYVAPGAQLPLVFPTTTVWFSAGSTNYELAIRLALAVFDPPPQVPSTSGETTTGHVNLTLDQRLLLLALTEAALLRADRSFSSLPTSAEAAERLGWPLTKFNRKLDHICAKLTRSGVRGLRGKPDQLAANRRFRLAEYALAARLVSSADLALLDKAEQRAKGA